MTTKEKRRLYNKKYYKEHAEKAKAYAKEYRKNNKKVRKVWREKNKEKIRIQSKKRWEKYSKDNQFIEKLQEYRKNNRGKKRKQLREWRKNNSLKVKIYSQKDNLRRRKAGKVTTALLQLVYERNIKRFGRLTCYLCGLPIQLGEEHLEHKIPVSRGGTSVYENLGIACASCNSSKHTKTEEEYRKYMENKEINYAA
jgi:5-methylcytosine-specific restriction endonuclease McrA